MSLNAEQTELVNRGINAKNPFDIGFCFNAALEAMKNNFWTIVIGHIIWLAAIAILEFSLVGLLLVPALAIGMFRFNLSSIRNQSVTISDIFRGFDLFGPSLAWAFVHTLLIILGSLLCILPGIYLSIAWVFSLMILADKKYGFWESMEISRQVITANWGWMFLLLLVSAVIAVLGVLGCGVGFFITLPFSYLMLAAAYTRAFDSQDETVSI
jgi:uncharacterized membrane protein